MGIKVKDIKVSYSKKVIIDDLNYEFEDEKITTVIGANGCGKSTLLKTIMKLKEISKGFIYLDKKNINSISRKELANDLSFLSQVNNIVEEISVIDVVKQGQFLNMDSLGRLSEKSMKKINDAIKITGLKGKENKSLLDLSGGEVQRVWIALCLAQDSKYIILDEPTNHLDIKYSIEILNLIKELNTVFKKTIIMVLHDINLASRYSDNILALKNGEVLVHGEVNKVIKKENIDNIFDVNSEIITCPIFNKPYVIVK